MRDRLLILAGLFVVVAALTFPIWYAPLAKTTAKGPDLQLPDGHTLCVEAREYMRSSHMQLLLRWRDAAVRHGQRKVTGEDGRTFQISLSKTCLGQCHLSKAKFCDRCHEYAAVPKVYCWDCHQTNAEAGDRR
jgi:hypothetical protein